MKFHRPTREQIARIMWRATAAVRGRRPHYLPNPMDDTSTFVLSLRSWTPEWLIAVRLGLACLLGGLIGLEREIGHHDAGLRTHILVALASCVFTLVAWELYQHIRAIEQPATGDPVRIIEAVTAGAGFLAAGIIFQSGSKVHGLTTGAGVWTAAAIGVACGSGAYAIAIITTILVLIVLFGFAYLKRKMGWDDDDVPQDRASNSTAPTDDPPQRDDQKPRPKA
jgi:putative Mg2+ transporter-C (MgtC) family protein